MSKKDNLTPEERLQKAIELTVKAQEVSDENNYEIGEGLLAQAVALMPEHPDLVNNYVNFCIQVGDNNLNVFNEFEEAIKYYQKALNYDEENTDLLTALASAYKEKGSILEAFATLQKIEKIKKKKK